MSGPYPATLKAMFAALADKPLQFPMGTETRYTQTNYVVLSALLEAHYNKPYRMAAGNP
jgi:CubicO group peptidase (beta-lactamase class C family)